MRSLRIWIRSAPRRARIAAARRSARWSLRLILGTLVLHAGGCARPQDEAARCDPAVAAIAQERAGLGEPGFRGKLLYENFCAVCHGLTGAGDGFNADNLTPPPPDLRGIVRTRGEQEVASVIREGSAAIGKSPLCPPYGRSLGEAERALIVAFLKDGWTNDGETGSR